MAAHPYSDQLRDRAATLRLLSASLSNAPALTLYMHAGTDTWIGPSPQRCSDELRAARATLLYNADDLLLRARRLERHADEYDMALLAASTR